MGKGKGDAGHQTNSERKGTKKYSGPISNIRSSGRKSKKSTVKSTIIASIDSSKADSKKVNKRSQQKKIEARREAERLELQMLQAGMGASSPRARSGSGSSGKTSVASSAVLSGGSSPKASSPKYPRSPASVASSPAASPKRTRSQAPLRTRPNSAVLVELPEKGVETIATRSMAPIKARPQSPKSQVASPEVAVQTSPPPPSASTSREPLRITIPTQDEDVAPLRASPKSPGSPVSVASSPVASPKPKSPVVVADTSATRREIKDTKKDSKVVITNPLHIAQENAKFLRSVDELEAKRGGDGRRGVPNYGTMSVSDKTSKMPSSFRKPLETIPEVDKEEERSLTPGGERPGFFEPLTITNRSRIMSGEGKREGDFVTRLSPEDAWDAALAWTAGRPYPGLDVESDSPIVHFSAPAAAAASPEDRMARLRDDMARSTGASVNVLKSMAEEIDNLLEAKMEHHVFGDREDYARSYNTLIEGGDEMQKLVEDIERFAATIPSSQVPQELDESMRRMEYATGSRQYNALGRATVFDSKKVGYRTVTVEKGEFVLGQFEAARAEVMARVVAKNALKKAGVAEPNREQINKLADVFTKDGSYLRGSSKMAMGSTLGFIAHGWYLDTSNAARSRSVTGKTVWRFESADKSKSPKPKPIWEHPQIVAVATQVVSGSDEISPTALRDSLNAEVSQGMMGLGATDIRNIYHDGVVKAAFDKAIGDMGFVRPIGMSSGLQFSDDGTVTAQKGFNSFVQGEGFNPTRLPSALGFGGMKRYQVTTFSHGLEREVRVALREAFKTMPDRDLESMQDDLQGVIRNAILECGRDPNLDFSLVNGRNATGRGLAAEVVKHVMQYAPATYAEAEKALLASVESVAPTIEEIKSKQAEMTAERAVERSEMLGNLTAKEKNLQQLAEKAQEFSGRLLSQIQSHTKHGRALSGLRFSAGLNAEFAKQTMDALIKEGIGPEGVDEFLAVRAANLAEHLPTLAGIKTAGEISLSSLSGADNLRAITECAMKGDVSKIMHVNAVDAVVMKAITSADVGLDDGLRDQLIRDTRLSVQKQLDEGAHITVAGLEGKLTKAINETLKDRRADIVAGRPTITRTSIGYKAIAAGGDRAKDEVVERPFGGLSVFGGSYGSIAQIAQQAVTQTAEDEVGFSTAEVADKAIERAEAAFYAGAKGIKYKNPMSGTLREELKVRILEGLVGNKAKRDEDLVAQIGDATALVLAHADISRSGNASMPWADHSMELNRSAFGRGRFWNHDDTAWQRFSTSIELIAKGEDEVALKKYHGVVRFSDVKVENKAVKSAAAAADIGYTASGVPTEKCGVVAAAAEAVATKIQAAFRGRKVREDNPLQKIRDSLRGAGAIPLPADEGRPRASSDVSATPEAADKPTKRGWFRR